jgi:glycopeptide antibiotics resistance protein
MTITISGVLPFLVFAAFVPVLIWRGRRRNLPASAIAAQLLLGAWIAAIVAVTLFPLPWRTGGGGLALIPGRWEWPAPWAQITPFATIRMSLDAGFGSAAGRVLIGNLVAFVPLGFLAPIVDRRWQSAARILLLGIVASAAVELAQLAWDLFVGMPWRSADIDDVIVNTAGTMLGYVAWSLGTRVAAGRRATLRSGPGLSAPRRTGR